MPILTHGSDLSLAPTLRPFVLSAGGSPRKALQAVAEAGFTAVQLDATIAGLRPRELDTSARRDLAVTIRRTGLRVAGIDFWIPTEHYRDAGHINRAAEAAHAALALASDLGRLPLSLALPVADAEPSFVQGLLAAADGFGVRLALHDEAGLDALRQWLAGQDEQVIGMGVDPATLLAARHDPVTITQQLGNRLAVARLSDARRGQADGNRTPVGRGDLDLTGYRVSVDLSPGRVGPVVLDLRMLSDPIAAATVGQQAWGDATVRM